MGHQLVVWKQELNFTQNLCAFLDQKRYPEKKDKLLRIQGFLKKFNEERWELLRTKLFFEGSWIELRSPIILAHQLSPFFRKEGFIELEGHLKCAARYSNFGSKGDFLFHHRARNLSMNQITRVRARKPDLISTPFLLGSWFRNVVDRSLNLTPELRAVVWAVWTGETFRLDPRLVDFYTEGGLLPLVALSGQHVGVFVSIVKWLVTLLPQTWLQWSWMRRKFRFCLLILPLLSCAILAVTSFGCPSVIRTLAMAASLVLLRVRYRTCSSDQLLLASSALLIAWDPSLIEKASFILSLNGAYLLMELSESGGFKKLFSGHVIESVLMSFITVPMVLFYFGRWSYLAPVLNLVLSGLWTLLIIPVGFLTPLIFLFPKVVSNPLLTSLDTGWHQVSEFHLIFQNWVSQSVLRGIRLSALEALLFQISALCFLKGPLKRFLGVAASRS